MPWNNVKRTYVAARIRDEHAERLFEMSVQRGLSVSHLIGEAVKVYIEEISRQAA
jgi:hypothetical protein